MTRITDELVIVVAGTSWDGIWMPERHVALQLAERVPVLWIDPAISRLTPRRDPVAGRALAEPGLRTVAPNVLRLSPVTVPGVTRPGLRQLAVRQSRAAARRAIGELGARVRATIVAGLDDMLDVVPAGARVFYGTDDLVAGAALTGAGSRYLVAAERRQLAKADTVIAISPVLAAKWSARHPDVRLVPNGCDAAHFAADDLPRPADVTLAGPVAGFAGHLSERIDLAMLDAVAATGISLLLVGPRQPTFAMARLDALLARPNVQWVGPKPFAELPAYLACMDVGLTPYARSDFNLASFPLKTLEYLAAGRPVVASDLPAHHWLDTGHVTIAGTPEAFAARAVALAAARSGPAEVAARRAVAAGHTWAARAAEIAAVLGLGETPTRLVPAA
jgi:teichuronic acid biosynthesis glycosyltransferase TuaH